MSCVKVCTNGAIGELILCNDKTLNALELALGAQAVRYPDCAEGVRAVLVDKDRNPTWQSL